MCHAVLRKGQAIACSFVLVLVAILSAAPARADVAAWMVVDAGDGTVLEQYSATRPWHPASLTKMMTAYVVFRKIEQGELTLSSPVVVSAAAHELPPSKMGFKVGTQVSLHDALMMLMVKSANDIAASIAHSVAGSEDAFVQLMNGEARRLGMSQTTFVNPHGLPDERQVTSARDMALMGMALWNHFPQYHDYLNKPAIRFGKRTMKSGIAEYLLRVPGASGIKTGYICDSGFNVVVTATRKGRTLLAVVLGSASELERNAFARRLIETGFKRHRGPSIADLNTAGSLPLPEPRYCQRNKQPDAQQLVDRFGEKRVNAPLLAYAKTDQPAPAGLSVFKDNKRIDWTLVHEQLMGPRLAALQPYEVHVGKPASAIAQLLVPGAEVPLPMPKPFKASPVAVPADVPVPPRKQSYLRHPDPFVRDGVNGHNASLLFAGEAQPRVQLVDRDAGSPPIEKHFFGGPGGLYKSEREPTRIN